MGFVYSLAHTSTRLISSALFSFQALHRERRIESGPLIIAMNHQSFIDPPIVGSLFDREVYYLARKSLTDSKLGAWIFSQLRVIPVDRDGADIGALRAVVKTISSGEAVVLFPEGTRTSDGALQPARRGIGFVIAKTKAPVLPVRIFGSFNAWPRTRKLPRRAPVAITMGEPIRFTAEDYMEREGIDLYQDLADKVMAAIAALEPPPNFDRSAPGT
jgi:1-acyl-sn-glycerol-3-phosphate acyltransferase